MQAGVVFGTAAMIDGICDKMEQELGRKVKPLLLPEGSQGYCQKLKA
jgi:pantothenate kinase type III